jgi:hypothetical protein
LTFAVVIIAAPPHALLTVSHDVPVRRPFTLSRLSPPNAQQNCKPTQIFLRGRTCTSNPRNELIDAFFIAIVAATP